MFSESCSMYLQQLQKEQQQRQCRQQRPQITAGLGPDASTKALRAATPRLFWGQSLGVDGRTDGF